MKIPTNLEECFELLFKNSTKEDLIEFTIRKENKDGFIYGYHFTAGMAMKNNWGLWRGKNKLVKYFNKLGIYHADDISQIILTSFHRHFNKKPIELEKQVKFYKDYWKKQGFKNGNPLEKK